MAPQVTGHRIFYGDFEKVFALQQSLYKKPRGEAPLKTAHRRAFYRNSVLSTLAQVSAYPSCRVNMYGSLIPYINHRGGLDGLESLFLTLLWTPEVQGLVEFYEAGLQTWRQFANTITENGAGGVVFYDVRDGTLTPLSREATNQIRNGFAVGDRTSMGSNIRGLSTLRISNVFRFSTVGHHVQFLQPQLIRVPHLGTIIGHQHLFPPVEHAVAAAPASAPPPKPDILKDGVLALASTLVAGGVGLETFPLPEPNHKAIGALCVLTGLVIEDAWAVGEFIGDVMQLSSNTVDTSGSQTEITPGTLVQDPQGNIGSSEPSVDMGGDDEGSSEGGAGEGGEGGSGCFVADTLVSMANGSLMPISAVRTGHLVLGMHGGFVKPCVVTQLHRHPTRECLTLHLQGGTSVTASLKQRFSLTADDRTFEEAQNLLKKSLSSCVTAETLRAGQIDVLKFSPAGQHEVYNLTVAEGHTFFVCAEGLLVHNRKIEGPGPEEWEDHD